MAVKWRFQRLKAPSAVLVGALLIFAYWFDCYHSRGRPSGLIGAAQGPCLKALLEGLT